ncbi:hypothetical protein [Asanoa iriomotensis]|uniref:hypothetical protein n=1 Tax=Asanoa iriomotensis TaxID=234613 RepID=UPI0019451D96|nr:hypothetical protein [Asanoa iriomotensis]
MPITFRTLLTVAGAVGLLAPAVALVSATWQPRRERELRRPLRGPPSDRVAR